MVAAAPGGVPPAPALPTTWSTSAGWTAAARCPIRASASPSDGQTLHGPGIGSQRIDASRAFPYDFKPPIVPTILLPPLVAPIPLIGRGQVLIGSWMGL